MKTALVIGAASGIGRGIADAIYDIGFKVIRADISFPKERQDHTVRYIDATNEGSIIGLTNFLKENSITPDCLIITIGAIDEGRVTDYQIQNLSWMIDINLLAPYRLVQHLIPFLRNSNKPKILLTGSGAGLGLFEDTHNLMPYIVSKHALIGYFKALRTDLAKEEIQVSLFLPNRIKGRLSENSSKMRETFLKEKSLSNKGEQPANFDLAEPYEIAVEVLKKFLAGKTYISNNPQMILDKLQGELFEVKRELFDE